jgi:hypothetical protein
MDRPTNGSGELKIRENSSIRVSVPRHVKKGVVCRKL